MLFFLPRPFVSICYFRFAYSTFDAVDLHLHICQTLSSNIETDFFYLRRPIVGQLCNGNVLHRIRAQKCIVSYSIWTFDDVVWQFASQQIFFHIKWKLFHELLCAMLGVAFSAPNGIAVWRCVVVLFACRQFRLDDMNASRLRTSNSAQPTWERLEMPSTAQLSLNKVLLRMILIKWIYRRQEHELWWAAAAADGFNAPTPHTYCGCTMSFTWNNICFRQVMCSCAFAHVYTKIFCCTCVSRSEWRKWM